MADQLTITGGYNIMPLGGVPSFAPNVDSVIDESVILGKKIISDIELTADAATPVAFGGVTNAHVVMLRTVESKVTARITSADGSQQLVPVDPALVLVSYSVPITAIDLIRVPATTTNVRVVLGEKA